jgi:peptide/nickel transport system substrate-binding protein
MVNVDPDPNGQMNVWLSSAAAHAWNPAQPKPATAWEAEIDRLMLAQSAEPRASERKRLFDRVQEIAAEQQPVLFLVHPNALAAASRRVLNLQPSVLTPQIYWNVERLDLAAR